jgi:2-dehydro-3-deoxyphosphogluconate aldolase/(4S)-4-hydroxy-2-oxoglutarate aldolase
MLKLDILNRIRDEAIIAIIRADQEEGLITAVEALLAGDVSVIEVTMTTPGALEVIRHARQQFGQRVIFGAGTVLDSETARLAILAGAQLIVTPTLELDVLRMCNRYGIPAMIGCYTPSEIKIAWEQGADMVKLFPASHGGIGYLKAVRAPLPQVAIVPSGGVNAQNAADFLRAGAFALGVGDSLVNSALLAAGNTAELTRRALVLRRAVAEARAQPG